MKEMSKNEFAELKKRFNNAINENTFNTDIEIFGETDSSISIIFSIIDEGEKFEIGNVLLSNIGYAMSVNYENVKTVHRTVKSFRNFEHLYFSLVIDFSDCFISRMGYPED